MSERIIYYPEGEGNAWADAREFIVRCRDCAHFASDELGDYCTLLDFEDVKSMGNGFCAWGERSDA